MELKKHFSSVALAALLFAQLTTGALPAFQPLVEQSVAQTTGDFQIEGASEKYSKTWIATITCRTANGGTQQYGPEPFALAGQVATAIRNKNLPYRQPTVPLLSSTNGGGGGNRWNIGTPHTPTLDAVCKILGSAGDSYISFTCLDSERSGRYPNGKCNFHSPHNNQLMRFVGTFAEPTPNFTATKTADRQIVRPGEIITYTVAVRNNDTNATQNSIVVTDAIPSGLTYVSNGSTSGCSVQGGNVVCQPRNFTPGMNFNYILKFQVPQNQACGQGRDVRNTATVSQNNANITSTNVAVLPLECVVTQCNDGIDNDGDGLIDAADPSCHTDNNPNNPASYNPQHNDESPPNTPQISAQKTADRQNVRPGDIITYTVVVHNNSVFPAQNLVLSDAIPSGLTYVSNGSTQGCAVQGGSVVCQPRNLTPNMSFSYILKFQVPANRQCGGTNSISNTATVKQGSTTLASTNVAATPVQCPAANFTATKTADRQIVRPGEIITYTVAVRNNDTNATQNSIVVTDAIPSGLTYVSNGSTSGCSVQGGNVVCQPRNFTPGMNFNYILKFQVPQNQACGQGRDVRNTATVSQNNANITSTNVAVLPLECVVTQCNDGIDNDGDGAIDLDDFSCQNNPNHNDEANPKAQCQDGIDNDGDGLIDAADPSCHTDNNPNNPASYNPQHNDESPPNTPQISAQKTADRQNVRPGEIITYTVHVHNGGNITAQNLVLSDAIPSGLTYVSNGSTQGCAVQGGSVVCQPRNFTPNMSFSYFLKFQVPANRQCGGTNSISNTATVKQGSTTLASTNVAATPVQCPAATLTSVVVNGCNVTVNYAKSFQPCAHLLSAPNGQTPLHTQNLFCNSTGPVTTLLSNFHAPFAPGASVKLCNGNDYDSCSAPVTVTGGGTCTPQANFTATKTADRQVVRPNEIITYTVAVRNNDTANAQNNIVVSDTIPSGFTFYPTGSTPECWVQGGVVLCQPRNFTPGMNFNYILRFLVAQDRQCGGATTVSNTATVKQGTTTVTTSSASVVPVQCNPQCSDGIDNDGDGAIDLDDFSCQNNPNHNDEANPKAQCQDGIDNDGDGLIDMQDPGCDSPQDNSEDDSSTVCPAPGNIRMRIEFIKVENVGTGNAVAQVDLGNGQTVAPGQNFDLVLNGNPVTDPELPKRRGINVQRHQNSVMFRFHGNDNDNFIARETMHGRIIIEGGRFTGFTNGSPIHDPLERQGDGSFDETAGNDEVLYRPNVRVIPFYSTVSNGSDNFTLTYAADPFCAVTQCSDGIDNDGDGFIDMEDPGCTSPQDNDEGPRNAPRMTITKTGPATAAPGSTITYNFVATNNEPVTVRNVAVLDNYPSNLTFVSGSDNCRLNPLTPENDVVCGGHDYTPGQTRTFTMTFTVNQASACNAVIRNGADLVLVNQGWSFLSSQQTSTTVQCNPQCSDGIDNDGDGLIDYPHDPGCTSPQDNDESNAPDQCVIAHASVYQGAGSANYAKLPSNLPSNITVRTFDLYDRELQASDLIGAKLFIYGDRNLGSGPFRNVTAAEQAVLRTAHQQGLHMTFAADNPTADEASVGTRGFLNAIQNAMVYSPTYHGQQSGIHTPDTVTFPFLQGKVFNFSNSGLNSPGDIVSIQQPAVCAFSLGNRCHAGWIPASGQRGFIFVEGNAGVGSENYLRNFITMACSGAPLPAPRFVLSKTDNRTHVQPGESLTYVLNIQNTGNAAGTNVVLTDTLPQGVTFVSASNGGALNGSTVTWTIPTIAAGDTVQRTITVSVNQNVANGTVLTNTANVVGATAASDTTTVQVIPKVVDLQVTMTGPTSAQQGQNVTYVATVRNNGPDAATTPFSIRNPVPQGLVYQPQLSTQGCVQSGNDIVCSGITLAVNESRPFTFVFNIPNTVAFEPNFFQRLLGLNAAVAATCGQSFTNTVTIFPTQPDPNSGNNSASVTTQVTCEAPIFTATKTAPTSVSPGEILSYLITITNTGNSTQGGIRIVDQIPAGLTFVPTGTTQGCTQQGGAVVCQAQSFTPGQSASYTLKFQANQNISCTAQILNTVAVQQNGTKFTQSNTTSTVPQCALPRLDVTKSAPPTVNIGGTVTYNYTLRNTSTTQAATQIELYDFNIDPQANPIPAQFTFQSISVGSCDPVDNQGRIHCNLPNLNPNQVLPFTITFSVPNNQNLCNKAVINQVDVWTQGDIDNADWDKAQTVVLCPVQSADVSITKTAPGSVSNDNALSFNYTLNVTNSGPAIAQNVVVTDNVPQGLVVTTPLPQGCSANGNVVSCNLGTLAVNTPRTITIGVTAPARSALCNQTVTNTASVVSETQDTNMQNNQSSAPTQIICTAQTVDVGITKTAPVEVDNDNAATFNYTLAVLNSGTAAAQNVVVTDNVPQGLVLGTMPQGCSANGNVVSCNLGTLAPATPRSIVIPVSLPARSALCRQDITNTATVTTSSQDTNAQNNTSSATTYVRCTTQNARLYITKDGPASINAGATITYNFTLQNTSAFTATHVNVYDFFIDQNYNQIASPFTFVSSTGLTCALEAQSGKVKCEVGDLDPQEFITFTMTFQTPANAPQLCNQTIVNRGEAMSNYNPSTTDADTVQTTFVCPTANFGVTKTADQQTIQPGGTVTYTIVATNNGQTAQQNVSVVDAVPGNLTFVSAGSTQGCVQVGTSVFCPAQNYNAGQPQTTVLKFQLSGAAQCGGNNVVNNVAVLHQNNQQIAQSNHAVTPIQCIAQSVDLQVNLTGPQTVAPGQTATYVAVVKNNGPTAATQPFTLRNTVPDGFIYVPASSTQGCVQSGNDIVCSGITLAVGEERPFTFVYSVPLTITMEPNFFQKLLGLQPAFAASCGQTVTNTATVVPVQPDPNTANNTSSVTTLIQCQAAQFTISKLGPTNISPGELLTYLITVTNTGTSSQGNVRIADAIPAGLTFVPTGTTQGCTQEGNSVVCPAQTFTPGQSAGYTLRFQANQNIACGTPIQNTALVQQNNTQIAQSNVWQSDVQCAAPRLDITKSAPPTVTAGGTATYNFTLRNTSSTQTATEVELYDFNIDAQANPIMPYFTFQSISIGQCDPVDNQGRIHCNLPDLTPNQVVNFTMTFSVPNIPAICNQLVINQVDVWTQGDIDNADWDKAQTVVLCQSQDADLSVVKTSPASAPFGSTVTYSLAVNNAGPATATNVVLKDAVPAGMTFVSATGATCALTSASEVTCQIGSVTTGNPVNIQMTFNTPAVPQNCTPGTATNTATLTSSSVDPNTGNNTSSATTALTCPVPTTADASVVKTGTTPSAVRGGTMNYNVLVNNAGPANATNVTFVDVIPAGMTFATHTSTGNATCSATGGLVTCSVGNMNANTFQTVVLAFNVTAQTPTCTPGSATNRVDVTSQPTDPNTANNTSSVTTQITCPDTSADVAITKFGPPTAVRGQNVTYSLIATNLGPNPAQNIVISDPIPAGLTFVSTSGGTCTATGSSVQCTVASLPSGQSTPIISVTFAIPAATQTCTAGSITNTATVTSGSTDPNSANNTSSATTAVTCPDNNSDLAVVKSGPQTAVRGTNVTYTLTVTNNGTSSNPTTYTVTDAVPSGMTFVSQGSSQNCALQGSNVVCTGSLGFGPGPQSTQLTLVFNLTTAASCAPGTVTNTASITGTNPDPIAGNNTSSVTTSVTCPDVTSDLSITKTGPTTIARGNNLTYTLTVAAIGTSAAQNTYTVTDAVPAGLTFVTAGSSNNCTLQGSNVVCTGSITNGQSLPHTLVFSAPTIQNCTQSSVTNTATVAGAASFTDSNTANNTSTVTTTLTCPTVTTDLSVTKTGPATVARGANLAYTITAVNNGPDTATNVVVSDSFSTEFTYVSASGATCTANGNVLTCTIGTMTPSQNTPITVNFTVKNATGTCSQTSVTNTATITSDTADSNTANNTSAAVTTQLTCATGSIDDISVFKTDNRSSANVGERLRYSIILTNNSVNVVNDLTVTDNVPFGMTILTVSDGGNVSGQQVRWTGVSVPASSSRTLYIDVEVRHDVANGTNLTNTVDVNGKTASDQTTVNNNTFNPPPPPPPPFFPPNPPPPYYPPNPPPPYYPPNPPPVYYPPKPTPPIVYPQTGDQGTNLYADRTDSSSVSAVRPEAAQDDNGFSAVFYATLIAFLAAGSAVASRFLFAL